MADDRGEATEGRPLMMDVFDEGNGAHHLWHLQTELMKRCTDLMEAYRREGRDTTPILEIRAKLKNHFREVLRNYTDAFALMGQTLAGWDTFSDAERSYYREDFFRLVRETPLQLRRAFFEVPNLPDEWRAELEGIQ
jgi:hypothetical protein